MSFTLDLNTAIENIKENRDDIIRGTISKVATLNIKATPVGNPLEWAPQSLPAPKGYVGGSLRGAWQASIGAPNFTKTGVIDKSGSATAAKASAVASTLEMGQTYYLTNPLPYARRVEFGWSQQAPTGMLRNAIMLAQRELDRLAK